jgi:hypothetical protein
MKNKSLPSFRCPLLVGRLVLGLAVLLSASANAEGRLKNGSFEAPFPVSDPTAGWAIVFQEGGPSDWSIAGQSTEASAPGGGRGAHLRASNINYGKAYFRQVVTNLTEGASYTLNILKMKTGFKYSDEGTRPKLRVYTSMISGLSSNAVHGYSTNDGPYSLAITCSASRQIEVQLHNEHDLMVDEGSEDFKSAKCTGWFDEFSLLTQRPIESIQKSNGVVMITWDSVAGETYRVQYRTDVAGSGWTDLPPDVVATGPTANKTDAAAGTAQRYYRVMLVLQ